MEKLKIGGLKQSLGLCQYDLRGIDSYRQLTFCAGQDKFLHTSEILRKESSLPMGSEITCHGFTLG
jgi:hypothetical protein